MKGSFLAIIFLLFALSVYGQSRNAVGDSDVLDKTIREAATNHLNKKITHGTVLAVLSIQSEYTDFSKYIISEIEANITDDGFFTLVDRQQLDDIRTEQNFQLSGDVDDKSAVEIGKMLGAQTIITGSASPLGSQWRISIRVLDVLTGKVPVRFNKNIPHSETIEALTGIPFTQSVKSVGEKIETGALNILLGFGSYIEGDISGGITITAGYTVAAGLIVLEFTALDWANPMVGVPITAGVSIAGLTLAYGFVRPLIYNRSPQMAHILDNTQSGIAMTQDRFGNNAFAYQLSCSIKF